jgi:iron complex outermembrane receptor protein
MDVRALLSENWMLTGGLAYTKAEIDTWVGAQCWSGQTAAQGCVAGVQDLSGQEMSNSPDMKGSFALEYNTNISDNHEFFGSLAYQWQSEMFYDLKGDPESTQDAYGIANLNLGIAELSDQYRVTFFVNNLFDKYYSAGVSNFRNFLGNGQELLMNYVPRGADRYMGLRVKYNF